MQDVRPVTDTQGFPDIVVGDENADAPALQQLYDLLDFPDGDRVHAGEGFIQQDERGLERQGPGNLHAALFTAGKPDGELVPEVVDAELLQQAAADFRARGGGMPARCFKHRQDVLFRGEPAEHRMFLGKIADPSARPLVHGQPGNVFLVKKNAAPGLPHQADNHVEAGGLAGAVRPEKAHHLVVRHLQ